MKKILLIEDVTSRQIGFMSKIDFKLEDYNDILENSIGKKYKEIAEELKNDTFNFDEYSMIMVHQSAFEDDVAITIDKLKNYCEKHKKALVLFSGVNSKYYNNSKYEYIELNTKEFYSNNLKLFLEAYRNQNQNILMLSYGEKWTITILLNILQKTNQFLEENIEEDIIYSSFKIFTKINEIENINYHFYDVEVEDDWVYRNEIIKLRDSILEYIQNY